MATRSKAMTKGAAKPGPQASQAVLADVISQTALLQLQLAKLYQSLLALQSGTVNAGDASEGPSTPNFVD